MTRSLDSDLETQSQQPVFGFVLFVSLAFPSGTLYCHNGLGTYTFNSQDWLGVGALGKVDVIEEGRNDVANPIRLTLSSITDEIVTAIQTDDVYGRAAQLYVGAIDSEARLLGTPTLWVDGYMESASVNLGSDNAVLIVVQDDAARLRLSNNRRYTIEEHQAEFSGDLFFEFLPYLMNAEVLWAGEKVRSGFRNEQGFTGDDDTPRSRLRRNRQDRR